MHTCKSPNARPNRSWASDNAGNEYVVMELVPLGSLDKILSQFGHFLRPSAKFQVSVLCMLYVCVS
jgi:hypothetical protein